MVRENMPFGERVGGVWENSSCAQSGLCFWGGEETQVRGGSFLRPSEVSQWDPGHVWKEGRKDTGLAVSICPPKEGVGVRS